MRVFHQTPGFGSVQSGYLSAFQRNVITGVKMDEGVYILLNRLCELHIGNHEEPQVAQPKYSRRQKLRITRIRSWNVLFSFLNGPHR